MTQAEYWFGIATSLTPKGVRFADWTPARFTLNDGAVDHLYHQNIGYEWKFADRSRIMANKSMETTLRALA